MTLLHSHLIEAATRSQSAAPEWLSLRKERVTASNFREVSHTRGPNAAENLAERDTKRDETNCTHEEGTGYGGRCIKGLCNSEKPQLKEMGIGDSSRCTLAGCVTRWAGIWPAWETIIWLVWNKMPKCSKLHWLQVPQSWPWHIQTEGKPSLLLASAGAVAFHRHGMVWLCYLCPWWHVCAVHLQRHFCVELPETEV